MLIYTQEDLEAFGTSELVERVLVLQKALTDINRCFLAIED